MDDVEKQETGDRSTKLGDLGNRTTFYNRFI